MRALNNIRVWPIFGLLYVALSGSAHAVIGTAWHIPTNTNDIPSVSMRNPYDGLGTNTEVFVYSGAQVSGGGNAGNQTDGTLFFRNRGDVSWQSAALGFDNNNGNNQYWKASFNTGTLSATNVIEYYLLITFSDKDDTYLYGGDQDGNTFSTGSEGTAQASPYSIRNRPIHVVHADNRVVSGNYGEFWTRVDYMGNATNANSGFVDQGYLYYTTDGSDPTGALGIATNTTSVLPFSFDHPEQFIDPPTNGTGQSMWWLTAFTNVPSFTPIKYRIGFYHSDNNEEKFADDNTIFSFQLGTVGDPVLTVNGVNANYTTSKIFIHEPSGETEDLVVLFEPNDSDVDPATVQLFSNVNRRDRADQDADNDGIEDGIQPPSGDLVSTNDTHYYKAYPMTPTGTAGQYGYTLLANKTGAYRLSARYQTTTNPGVWIYYSTSPRRDHAVTVSPVDARNINLYEINTLTIEASNDTVNGRSTFEDLHDAPSAARTADGSGFNLDYLNDLGINWLWFQPIHPAGVLNREIDPGTGQPYQPGSPYSVKNFFEVNPLMTVNATNDTLAGRALAMTAFSNFVAAADSQQVEIMLDAPFNHTAHDVELAQIGVELYTQDGGPALSPTNLFRNTEARFFSRVNDYCERAFDAASIAPGPDRFDFGKWNDVVDVYFGRYDALVCQQNDTDKENYKNEGDWFDYSHPNWTNGDFIQGGVTQNVTRSAWKYFAEYALHWLDQTGYPANPSGIALDTNTGIDGLRCDFGQGLPPQCWEYIINVARDRKWNFVMMSESLDGGAVTYRSNRHFDILNENIVFPLASASNATDYQNIFENRRNAYGQGLVLLNTTSHDEENYVDPFEALIRYGVTASVDGAPLVFMGQELGISRTFGFTNYETNFGKQIGHFKKFNSLAPLRNPASRNFGLDQIFEVYSAMATARLDSPALRSSNRYFLDQTNFGGTHPDLWAVAKYETANASPATSDVVFAYSNIRKNSAVQGNFWLGIEQNGSNIFGVKTNRSYNIKNIAAFSGIDTNRNDQWIWGSPMAGTTLLTNGMFVAMNPVPSTEAAWTNAPFEAQYLKLYDVTPPPTSGLPSPGNYYAITNLVTFTWGLPALGPDDALSHYLVDVGTSPGSNDVVAASHTGTNRNLTVAATYGQTLFASVTVVSTAGSSSTPALSNGTIDPALAHTPIKILDPDGDEDSDGLKNSDEQRAGTNPLLDSSVHEITQTMDTTNGVTVVAATIDGQRYRIQFADDFNDKAIAPTWTFFNQAAQGTYDETSPSGGTVQFLDDFDVNTSGGEPLSGQRIYRILTEPTP